MEPKRGEYERVFKQLDVDGDGKVSAWELRRRCVGAAAELSQAEAEAAVESLDSDGDGLLEYEDFVRLMEAAGEEEKARDLREAFGMFVEGNKMQEGEKGEGGGNECITPRSLKRMLSRLGESKSLEECRVMIGTFDLDGDGVLSFDEFMAMMA